MNFLSYFHSFIISFSHFVMAFLLLITVVKEDIALKALPREDKLFLHQRLTTWGPSHLEVTVQPNMINSKF